MDVKELEKRLIIDEDRRNKMYKCSADKWTIGIGHNIEDNGISDAVIDLIFQEDIREVLRDLGSLIREFDHLPENIQQILANMRFQLGYGRFRGFKNMIKAVNVRDWPGVLREMKDSKWYRERHISGLERVNNLINMAEEVAR